MNRMSNGSEASSQNTMAVIRFPIEENLMTGLLEKGVRESKETSIRDRTFA